MATETISQDLADLLATKNFDPKYTDAKGADSAPDEAVVLSFDWVAPSKKNYGTAVFVVSDNDLQFFFGDNLGKSIENPEDKEAWFQFLEQMSDFATQHRYTWSPKDINQLKHTMAGMAAIKEGLFEGYYGTRRVSYMGEQTQARLVIKHNRMLGENDKRYRYVESLFIETADGERFKLPFTKLVGGRAMLEHVRQGGKPYDIRGSHICEMVTEMNLLARFNRASQSRIFEGSTQDLVESAKNYYQSLQENLKHLASSRGYNTYFESWSPADIGSEDALVEDIKTLFVEQTLDARIESALPLLAKIQQGTAMKEVNVFETWINRMAEGTWALPDTPEQEAKLQELMSAELIAGPDGTNATEQLYDIVGDDQLFDLINAAAAADPNTNIWDNAEIVGRLSELGVDVSNITQQGAEQTPEPAAAPAQPVAESRMAEVDSIIQSIIAGDTDPYDVMNHPQGPEEEYVAKILEKEYEDVAIEHRLHPDDDFEQILDRVVDRLAQDYGHEMDEGWKGTLAGSAAGGIAGDVAGSAVGPAAGAALGGAVGGLPGAIAGGALGAVAGGPIGSALGGLAGAKIGDKLGGSDEANEAKTGDIVKGAVKAATQGLGDIFGGPKPKDILNPVGEADTINSFNECGTVAGSVAPMSGELEEEDQWGQARQDPMNYNAAITGSYYENEDPLARLKTLALSK